ncbi:hypothetical protein MTO96_037878 [Rhipicephalus appendiculatus]
MKCSAARMNSSHDFQFVCPERRLLTTADFKTWKETVKKDTCFVAKGGGWEAQPKKILDFACHWSGSCTLQGVEQ